MPKTIKTVKIDFLPESVVRYCNGHAVVAVDVIRASTTVVTAVDAGRRCFPVPTVEMAASLAGALENPLMVGELGGDVPPGFHVTNSPALIAARDDVERPMVLLSSSGTKVMHGSRGAAASYVACLRNTTAQIRHLQRHHDNVVLVGAGSRGEFREEDQICCAWIAEGLVDAGFVPADEMTSEIIERWRGATAEAMLISKSVAYLRRTGQLKDLDYILAHQDDVPAVFALQKGEVVKWSTVPEDLVAWAM
jgi:2-phosphosulfolactate phosphatase